MSKCSKFLTRKDLKKMSKKSNSLSGVFSEEDIKIIISGSEIKINGEFVFPVKPDAPTESK
jgi:hypothetical protein